MASPQEEREMRSDHPQDGRRGEVGPRGPRGRSLTWLQALVVFLVVVGVSIGLSYRSERQQDQIRQNAAAIRDANYRSCLSGVIIVDRFNQQQDMLADIERTLLADPMTSAPGKAAAAARVKAYEDARTLPLPTCER